MTSQDDRQPTAAGTPKPTPESTRASDRRLIELMERHYAPAPLSSQHRRELDRQLWQHIEGRRRPRTFPLLAGALATCAAALALVTTLQAPDETARPLQVAAAEPVRVEAAAVDAGSPTADRPGRRPGDPSRPATDGRASAPAMVASGPGKAEDSGSRNAPAAPAALASAARPAERADDDWLAEEWSYQAGATMVRIDGSLPADYEAIAVAFLQY
jgi:hypothetical protein